MDKRDQACVFGVLIVATYITHQLTVGGDGIIFASVCTAIAAIGGYVLRGQS